jgi:hypothetical protein
MRTTVPASERATRPDGPAFPPNCFNNSPRNAKNIPPAESEGRACHARRKLFAGEPATHAGTANLYLNRLFVVFSSEPLSFCLKFRGLFFSFAK